MSFPKDSTLRKKTGRKALVLELTLAFRHHW
jgi:hypothetical protein